MGIADCGGSFNRFCPGSADICPSPAEWSRGTWTLSPTLKTLSLRDRDEDGDEDGDKDEDGDGDEDRGKERDEDMEEDSLSTGIRTVMRTPIWRGMRTAMRTGRRTGVRTGNKTVMMNIDVVIIKEVCMLVTMMCIISPHVDSVVSPYWYATNGATSSSSRAIHSALCLTLWFLKDAHIL